LSFFSPVPRLRTGTRARMESAASRFDYDTGHFRSILDLTIFTYQWLPKQDKPKAAVFLVHDFGEHSARYCDFASALNEHGFTVFAFDCQGHGRSSGQRGQFKSFEHWVRDTWDFLNKTPSVCVDLPKFLIGVGVGACVIHRAAVLGVKPVNFAGLVFLSPAVRQGNSTDTPGAIRPAGLFRRKVKGTNPHLLSRDPDVVANYRIDPLAYHGKIKSSTASQIRKAMAWFASDRSTSQMSYPLLLCQGTKDQIVSPFGAKHLHEQAPSKDKELKVYHGMFHDLLHDEESKQVIDDIISWLSVRVAAAAAAPPIPENVPTPRFFADEEEAPRSSLHKRPGSLATIDAPGFCDDESPEPLGKTRSPSFSEVIDDLSQMTIAYS